MNTPELCGQCGRLVYAAGTVMISAADYAALLRKAKVGETRRSSDRPYRVTRSKIRRDPEVEAFVVECSKTMIPRDIVAACIKRFGKARSPSRTAVYRYQASASMNRRFPFEPPSNARDK